MYLLGGIDDVSVVWGSLIIAIIVVDGEGGTGLGEFSKCCDL